MTCTQTPALDLPDPDLPALDFSEHLVSACQGCEQPQACGLTPPASPPPAPPAEAGFFDGLAAHSRLVQRLRRRYAGELPLLAPGAPDRASMAAAFAALRGQGHDTGAALRITRQLVVERLAVLDCEQQAPLEVVTRAMTELAEFALDEACRHAFAALDERHGAPLNGRGQRVPFWVIGMGKLGARELNVSSDIDLIYLHESDGDTAGRADGRGSVSMQEYFTRVARQIHALVGEVTEHGFVFRIDLALRPNGKSGPAVCALDTLAQYMHVQGREWERLAWLKSRVVAPQGITPEAARALRGVVLPFVFRKYLDYNVFEALRALHRQIREQASKRSAGRPGGACDVKLSRGGIREIEFIVQLLQVVRGGQFPELRTRATLQALPRLARAALMPEDRAQALAAAYTFLRRVEHRIQYLDDQQTHLLPTADADLDWLARSMGYAQTGALLDDLQAHREVVAHEFDSLLGGSQAHRPCNKCRAAQPEQTAAPHAAHPDASRNAPQLETASPGLQDLLQHFPPAAQQRLQTWATHPRVQALREQAHARLMHLLRRSAAWLAEGRISEEAVLRMADWLEPLLRRESYLALLMERPAVHERLLRVLGAARWPARYVRQHPGVIDELASPGLMQQRFDAAAFEQTLHERLAALASTGEDDEETLLDLLRRAHHAEVFRTLARDVEGTLTVEQVADDLSALADATLRVAIQWCWARYRKRHRSQPALGVIGYGKLGGKELGYGSDLDLVFVFDDDDPAAPDIYSGFARKLITWFTTRTGEGDLFEIDTALRPNGNSGLLVTSFAAYASYQQQRGSNTAWTWEHQAMTRARYVCGLPQLAPRFDAVRHAVITAERNRPALRDEIAAMRHKMRAAHATPPGVFDIKQSAGGMIDAEFSVQYLVLAHARQHPQLEPNLGNIALLQRAEAAALLPAGAGQAAANAYRALRHAQHIARLNEAGNRFNEPAFASERAAIQAVWQHLFG